MSESPAGSNAQSISSDDDFDPSSQPENGDPIPSSGENDDKDPDACLRSKYWKHYNKRSPELTSYSYDQDTARKALASAVIMHEYPLSIVEHVGFRRLALRSWLYSGNGVIKEMAQRMVEKFDKYWSVIHGVVGVLAVLDPRYKIKVMQFYFAKLFGGDYEVEVENIRAFCYKLVREYRSPSSMMEGTGDSSSQSSPMEVESLSEYDLFVLNENRAKSFDFGKAELDHYLSEDVLPRTPGFDVLGEPSRGYATIYDDAESEDSCVTRENQIDNSDSERCTSSFPHRFFPPSVAADFAGTTGADNGRQGHVDDDAEAATEEDGLDNG
ncbi:hypothetical protein Vadar_010163 [Vaccinium darrowii]|uniref:Uncharacterized protein n=1 Tax=Vaccinium darrowii TaxID=229202 RepID=A0ACB7X8Y0_9ERIC|nr:hypothetical protein Vadar_010163 [Vaccinium darrowii]